MTLKELLSFFENYYGSKYAGAFGSTVAGYLDGYSAAFYKAAAEVIVERFSHIYGKLPDVAAFAKHKGEILKSIPKPPPEPERELTEEERARGLECLEEIRRILGR